MAAKIFRINYKSDFILTLHSDAGWLTPFCIKFWTGAPSQAFYAGWDGTTYTHCAYDPSEPTKLVIQFDDHLLPIGDLKFQIAYHFTVADFPNDTEDEVINPANVTTEIDGQEYQVMLDFTGETAPEIEFSLPAYANEAQRIANEQQRERKFAQMEQDFETMQHESEAATAGAENVNAQLSGTTLTVTNRDGQKTSSNVQGPAGEPGTTDYNDLKNKPDLSIYATNSALQQMASNKQDKLVNSVNIKSINYQSLLGSGNLDISDVFIADYGSTSLSDIEAAYSSGKVIVARAQVMRGTVFFILTQIDSEYDPMGAYKFTTLVQDQLMWFSLGSINGYTPISGFGINSAIAAKYTKPSSGIPASDIANGVIPDVSQFITKSVNDLVNYYTKSETNALIGSIQKFHYEIYPSLQDITTPATNVLYLIGPTGSGSDKYEEYVYPNSTPQKIGDTSIDLSNYITTQALNSALRLFAQDLQTELNNYALKSQIKTVNGNSLIGSGDVNIHPEIVILTDGEHNSGYYENLMRRVGILSTDTPQIFTYTAYDSNSIASTAICISSCANTASPTSNAVFRQRLMLGTSEYVRTLSNIVEDGHYQIVQNWTLQAYMPLSGGAMTGNINMADHELQVRANRNGIKYVDASTGVLVGNGNMNMTIQSGNADLKHRKGTVNYAILDRSNVKTINGQDVYGTGNINIYDVFIVEYGVTTYSQILNAYTAGKHLILKYNLHGNPDDNQFLPLEEVIIYSDGGLAGTHGFFFSVIIGNSSASCVVDMSGYSSSSINLQQELTFDNTPTAYSNNPVKSSGIKTALDNKQDKLVSGTNIKTINNQSVLGSGNLDVKDVFIAEYGVTTYQQVLDAYNAGKIIVVSKDNGETWYKLDNYVTTVFRFSRHSYASTVIQFCALTSNNGWDETSRTAEDTSNKATDFTTLNNTKYPTTQAVADYVSTIVGNINSILDTI